jgi:hypothetical protein
MPKLSSYPTVAAFTPTDLLVMVGSGPANENVTRDTLLAETTAHRLQFQWGSPIERAGFSAIGEFEVVLNSGKSFYVTQNSVIAFQINPFGNVDVGAPSGSYLNITNVASQIYFSAAGALQLSTVFGTSVFVQYAPANVGDWVVPPVDLASAVDRIARVVSASGTIPIP